MNSVLKQIQELEKKFVALDLERNTILFQINQLKDAKKKEQENVKSVLTSKEKIALFRSLFRG